MTERVVVTSGLVDPQPCRFCGAPAARAVEFRGTSIPVCGKHVHQAYIYFSEMGVQDVSLYSLPKDPEAQHKHERQKGREHRKRKKVQRGEGKPDEVKKQQERDIGDVEKTASREFMLHRTSAEQAKRILREGLKTENSGGFIEAGDWADEYYGKRPIYLSNEPWETGKPYPHNTLLKVDVTGLRKYPDLPSLADHGAYLDDDEGAIYWEDEGSPFKDWEDENGGIELYDFLDDEEAGKAAHRLTGTAAFLEDIPPERISRFKTSKTAMPRDEEFLQNLNYGHVVFEKTDYGFPRTNRYTAQTYGGDIAGYIDWDDEQGHVTMIHVEPKYQRHGLASELWNRASDIDPRLHHSDEMTSDGRQWARALGPEDAKHVEILEGLEKTAQVQRYCDRCHKEISESEAGHPTGLCGSCREAEGMVTHHWWSEKAQEGHYGAKEDDFQNHLRGVVKDLLEERAGTCRHCFHGYQDHDPDNEVCRSCAADYQDANHNYDELNTPWDLNNGDCEEVAIRMMERYPDADEWVSEYCPEHIHPGHTAIIWHGKYYDAEAIEGVDDPHKLPIFQKKNPRPYIGWKTSQDR